MLKSSEIMYKGTVIENSLGNKNILTEIQIDKTWATGDWILYSVQLSESQIPQLAASLNEGPWYIHLWQPGRDDIKVIFKNKIFTIKSKDKSTWTEAINYGQSIGIPEEQLDFPTD
jgi:hypothetical protein